MTRRFEPIIVEEKDQVSIERKCVSVEDDLVNNDKEDSLRSGSYNSRKRRHVKRTSKHCGCTCCKSGEDDIKIPIRKKQPFKC